MIETEFIHFVTKLLTYFLVFLIGAAYGTYHSSKEFLKRNERLLQLLESAKKVIQTQTDVIEGMKKIRPVLRTVKGDDHADA